MGNLIKAEFRKTTTTGLWWGLLIPTVALALGWSLVTGAIGKSFTDVFNGRSGQEIASIMGIEPSQWKVSLFGMARSINVATIFPMIFGGLAISNEISKKTITTTFLTAPNRVSALGAKMIVYVLWGALYGVAIVGMVSIGIAITSYSAQLPDVSDWLALAAVGVLSSVLMTLLGVGVGALITSVVGTTLVLVLYMLLLENGLVTVLAGKAPHLAGFLPNGSADGLTGSLAVSAFLKSATDAPDYTVQALRLAFGALGAFDWWLSGLIFLGWTAVFFLGGWLVTQRKDIT